MSEDWKLSKYNFNKLYSPFYRGESSERSDFEHGMDYGVSQAMKYADMEMERVKACEEIANGEEGWQQLRNLCPSTMAVAKLRDAYEKIQNVISRCAYCEMPLLYQSNGNHYCDCIGEKSHKKRNKFYSIDNGTSEDF